MLEEINQPSDLKSLSVNELEMLAVEIRSFLIEKLSTTGGHLAPNLGVVELTLALHYLFDSPTDKFIFDVGHQAYVHKILTRRKHLFHTLRTYKGLSGFQKRSESEHDVWEAGHSSTSLSAAMGMAIARDLQGLQYKVIPIIGDGSMTGGMAFEALNHIGNLKKNMIVILNDNEMSIAPNVGALHNYLGKIRSDKNYKKMKQELDHLLKKIPAIGGKLAKTAERVRASLKYLLVSGVIFEELGLTYLGPVDGHNLPQLIDTLRQAEKLSGPVLVHVVTLKGKGYPHAEANSVIWHGLGTYKIESGEVVKSHGAPMYTEIFANAIVELAEQDGRIVAVTPAMVPGSGLVKFAQRFPSRLFDVGIAEQHAATMCSALAAEGMKPVFAVYSTFLQRAYDQVIHDICRQNLNVVFAIDRAGFVGPDGDTHQGVYDIAFLRIVPNMVIMMPKDENELRNMLKTALDYNKGPIAVRYPRVNATGVKLAAGMSSISIGTWEPLNTGTDNIAVLAVGATVQIALEAAELLKYQAIEVQVINARFIKPLDEAMLLKFAKERTKLITVEESSTLGGFGSAVLEFYAQQEVYGMQIKLMGIPDYYVEHGTIKEQRAEVGLTVDRLIQEVKTMLPLKKQHA